MTKETGTRLAVIKAIMDYIEALKEIRVEVDPTKTDDNTTTLSITIDELLADAIDSKTELIKEFGHFVTEEEIVSIINHSYLL